MPLEMISWLAAVLVMGVVVIKMITGHSVGAQKSEVTRLERERDAVRERLEQARNQRGAAEDNLEFYARRLTETQQERADLLGELERFEESARKHLEFLGYDDETIEIALRTGQLPEGALANDESRQDEPPPAPDAAAAAPAATDPVSEFVSEESGLDLAAPVAVVPATLRDADKLFLPDAMVTELLGRGLNIIDRSALLQRARAGGEDLGSILDTEQYCRLAKFAEVRALVVVNTRMRGSGVGSATCRVVELPSGKILMSTTYEQPGPNERSPEFEPLTRTAHVLAEAVAGLVHS
ncbi:MAG: hypothetical protein ABIL09_11930 [Gemmatimonadota bacterium]